MVIDIASELLENTSNIPSSKKSFLFLTDMSSTGQEVIEPPNR